MLNDEKVKQAIMIYYHVIYLLYKIPNLNTYFY